MSFHRFTTSLAVVACLTMFVHAQDEEKKSKPPVSETVANSVQKSIRTDAAESPETKTASDSTETEAVASDSTEIEAVASDSTETEAVASDSTETEAVASDSTETEAVASDSTETEAVASDSTSADSSSSAEEKSVVLKVTTDPEGASLSVDGKDFGLTPATVTDLDTGSYNIQLSKSGHYRRKAKVRIETYGLTELDFELLRPASLVIQSDPPKASVSIDGKQVGETPYENKKLRPGEHSITLNLSGLEPVEKKITLESGGSDTLSISLEPDEAQVAKVGEGKKRSFFNPGIVLISFFIFTAVLIGIEKTSI